MVFLPAKYVKTSDRRKIGSNDLEGIFPPDIQMIVSLPVITVVLGSVVYLEIVEPQTGEVLPDGERGELVISQLYKEAMPLFRYRTGDLSVLERRPCKCGYTVTLPFEV